jgi:translation initiation factor 1
VQDRRLVYSSDGGRAQPRREARDRQAPAVAVPNDGFVRVARERAHRGGKTVTVIRGLEGPEPDLAARLSELKRLCGAGGSLRDGALEIQGDHRERICDRLRALGYKVKLAGG